MMKFSALVASLSLTAAAVQAAGPEITPIEPVVVQPASSFWEGGYGGVQLGYAYSEFDLGSVTSPGDFDDDSVIGGFHLGYLWAAGNGFYVGPEFQYDFADITVRDATTGDTASFDEIARLKLIAGREIGNGFLYGSAGIAYASFDDVGTVFDGFNGDETNYVLGIGYDHNLGNNWSVGGEYMFHHFNNIGAAGEDVDVNTLHLKASYRF